MQTYVSTTLVASSMRTDRWSFEAYKIYFYYKTLIIDNQQVAFSSCTLQAGVPTLMMRSQSIHQVSNLIIIDSIKIIDSIITLIFV